MPIMANPPVATVPVGKPTPLVPAMPGDTSRYPPKTPAAVDPTSNV